MVWVSNCKSFMTMTNISGVFMSLSDASALVFLGLVLVLSGIFLRRLFPASQDTSRTPSKENSLAA